MELGGQGGRNGWVLKLKVRREEEEGMVTMILATPEACNYGLSRICLGSSTHLNASKLLKKIYIEIRFFWHHKDNLSVKKGRLQFTSMWYRPLKIRN